MRCRYRVGSTCLLLLPAHSRLNGEDASGVDEGSLHLGCGSHARPPCLSQGFHFTA